MVGYRHFSRIEKLYLLIEKKQSFSWEFVWNHKYSQLRNYRIRLLLLDRDNNTSHRMDDIFHSAGIIDWTMLDWRLIFCITCFCRLYVWCISSKWWYFLIKGSSDPNHFIFEINIGMRRIRHTKTLKLKDKFLDLLKI